MKNINLFSSNSFLSKFFFLLMFLSLSSGSSVLQMACDEANFSWIKKCFSLQLSQRNFCLGLKYFLDKTRLNKIFDYKIKSCSELMSEIITISESTKCVPNKSQKSEKLPKWVLWPHKVIRFRGQIDRKTGKRLSYLPK